MGVDVLDDGLIRFDAEKPEAAVGIAAQGPLHAVEAAAAAPPPTGACHVCQERPAAVRCVHCGRGTCRQDVWTMLGLCKVCATDEEIRRGRERADAKRPDLGIKWIED